MKNEWGGPSWTLAVQLGRETCGEAHCATRGPPKGFSGRPSSAARTLLWVDGSPERPARGRGCHISSGRTFDTAHPSAQSSLLVDPQEMPVHFTPNQRRLFFQTLETQVLSTRHLDVALPALDAFEGDSPAEARGCAEPCDFLRQLVRDRMCQLADW